jgi:hypothetical protein
MDRAALNRRKIWVRTVEVATLLGLIITLIQIYNGNSKNKGSQDKESSLARQRNKQESGGSRNGTPNDSAIDKKPTEEFDYISNKSFLNLPHSREMIVSISNNENQLDAALSLQISSIAFRKGYNSTASFFSNSFYKEKLEEQLLLGNSELIRKLNLFVHSDYLLIGDYSEEFDKDSDYGYEMTVDHLTYTLNLINLATGQVRTMGNDVINKNGFSQSDARKNAFNVLIASVQSKF